MTFLPLGLNLVMTPRAFATSANSWVSSGDGGNDVDVRTSEGYVVSRFASARVL
jgi:hypothetical protein